MRRRSPNIRPMCALNPHIGFAVYVYGMHTVRLLLNIADLARASSSCLVPQRVAALPANLGTNPSFSAHKVSRPPENILQTNTMLPQPIATNIRHLPRCMADQTPNKKQTARTQCVSINDSCSATDQAASLRRRSEKDSPAEPRCIMVHSAKDATHKRSLWLKAMMVLFHAVRNRCVYKELGWYRAVKASKAMHCGLQSKHLR